MAEIRAFIAADNPAAADRQTAAFFDRFHMLARSPEMGEARPDLGAELRVFSVGSYVIVFRQMAGGVEIARVVSGYRDLPPLLEGE
ncbi:MAG: type II toxin-antitoxin system RelE/ParE family toxin [Thermoguttaceae bacterium]|nr:type II toxin-antitoxin system RelE/ParE family toxin [Thermoguttaceae bacterium]